MDQVCRTQRRADLPRTVRGAATKRVALWIRKLGCQDPASGRSHLPNRPRSRGAVLDIFLAVDHCTSECVGLHAARRGTRLEALEPLRQAVRDHFGRHDRGVATGLSLRHDHGSQYMSGTFQDELRFLGIRSSPTFVAEPECNGVAERFVRTLKEQVLWVETFATIEDLRLALIAFKHRYNHGWLVKKHGHRTPAQARVHLKPAALAA